MPRSLANAAASLAADVSRARRSRPLLVLLVAAALGLAGCGGSGTSSGSVGPVSRRLGWQARRRQGLKLTPEAAAAPPTLRWPRTPCPR